MSDFTNFAENALVDHLLRGIAYMPAGIYVGLFTTPSSDAGPGTEVTGGSYARVPVGASGWTATQGGTSGASSGTSGQSGNVADVTFPAPTATWGIVSHFGLFDALTDGNLLMQKALTTPKTINGGDQPPKFAAGTLTVTLA